MSAPGRQVYVCVCMCMEGGVGLGQFGVGGVGW